MALIEINKDPSRRELHWFGGIFGIFFGLIGGLIWWRFDAPGVTRVLWVGAATILVFFYAFPKIRRPVYLGWMYASFPIGWVVSHTILALIYYLLFTPMGLLMRLFNRDTMQRRFDRSGKTYWVPHNPQGDPGRYFQQF